MKPDLVKQADTFPPHALGPVTRLKDRRKLLEHDLRLGLALWQDARLQSLRAIHRAYCREVIGTIRAVDQSLDSWRV